MRILYWLLGGAAAATATALIAGRKTRRKMIARFMALLAKDQVTVLSRDNSIPEPGVREEAFRGIAGGVRFHFAARTDKDAARWRFILTWIDHPILEQWNAFKVDDGLSLAAVHFALKGLPVRDKDAR